MIRSFNAFGKSPLPDRQWIGSEPIANVHLCVF